MNAESQEELFELAHGHIERSLTEEQHDRLEAILTSDPEARRIYVDYMHDHATLHWDSVADTDSDADVIPFPEQPQPQRRWSLLAGWGAAAAAMLVCAWVGSFYLYRRGAMPGWLTKVFMGMSFSGWIATLAGWYVTEVGRQPYLVYGVLQTEDAVTGLPAGNVAFSLTLYAAIYAVLLFAYMGTLTLMCRRSVEIEEITSEEREKAKASKISPLGA